VQSEAAAFLAQHLKDDGRWDWIIPMVPMHVALHWLLAVPGEVGLAAGGGAGGSGGAFPGAQRGPHGELYLSRAHHLCPNDCAEPEVCPVTGESRDLPLHQELASLHLADMRSGSLPAGNWPRGGGILSRRLLDLARIWDVKGQRFDRHGLPLSRGSRWSGARVGEERV